MPSIKKSVLLEGFHVCKHAIRFGAEIEELVTPNKEVLGELLALHASDIQEEVMSRVQLVSQEDFNAYSDITIRTPLAGRARLSQKAESLPEGGCIVYLDNPRNLENIGAVIRTAAGMGVEAVVTSGEHDPWHKNCLRGSQGLHFALPVVHESLLESEWFTQYKLIACDESGEELLGVDIPTNSILLFGSERSGLSQTWHKRADMVVRIPQQAGVSSYNLAASAAIVMYHTKCRK